MMSKPVKEHEWLQRLVGEWSYEHEAQMAPDQPAVKVTGTESVRSIGGLWVMAEGRGDMPGGGGTATMILTLGFDPQKGKFVGTWIGSMMSNLWVYDGALDAGGNALLLDTVGPDFSAEGKTARYRERIELKGDGERTFDSSVQGPDGNWTSIMAATYRRTK